MSLFRLDPRDPLDEAIIGYAEIAGLATTVYDYDRLVIAFMDMFDKNHDTDEDLRELAVDWVDYNCLCGPVLIMYPATGSDIDNRFRDAIKDAVRKSVGDRKISDEGGQEISIPSRNTHEPRIYHGKGGRREIVSPGNKQFNQGDKIKRPANSSGRGGGAGNQGGGEDEFTFDLTRQEYLDILFDGLELPNLQAKKKTIVESDQIRRAGYACDGTPSNLAIVKTAINSFAARNIKRSKLKKELADLKMVMAMMVEANAPLEQIEDLEEEMDLIRLDIASLPLRIDDHHQRFKNFEVVPKAITQCVVFCVMDVSGSMSRFHKDMAKRFFILLHTFLQTSYDKVEIVFIRHHSEAYECTEDEFFYSQDSGGTIVSSAFDLTEKIINERYSPTDWNIYVAQASDGDNFPHDSDRAVEILNRLLPRIQYMSYIEIAKQPQELWEKYETIQSESFQQARVENERDILPVFRQLFKRRDS